MHPSPPAFTRRHLCSPKLLRLPRDPHLADKRSQPTWHRCRGIQPQLCLSALSPRAHLRSQQGGFPMARGGRAVCTVFRVLSSQSKPTRVLLHNLLGQPDRPPSLDSGRRAWALCAPSPTLTTVGRVVVSPDPLVWEGQVLLWVWCKDSEAAGARGHLERIKATCGQRPMMLQERAYEAGVVGYLSAGLSSQHWKARSCANQAKPETGSQFAHFTFF